jgi:hypothetical protein
LGPPVKKKREGLDDVCFRCLTVCLLVADPIPLPHLSVKELEGLVLTLLNTSLQDTMTSTTDGTQGNDDGSESTTTELPEPEAVQQVR